MQITSPEVAGWVSLVAGNGVTVLEKVGDGEEEGEEKVEAEEEKEEEEGGDEIKPLPASKPKKEAPKPRGRAGRRASVASAGVGMLMKQDQARSSPFVY